MKKIFFLALCILLLSGCRMSKEANKDIARWPNFLRNWAADYKIYDAQKLTVINLIDSVYCILEDSTLSFKEYTDQICRMKDCIAEVITKDTSYEFTLMMKATATNFWGHALKDKRFFECKCSEEIIPLLVAWKTMNTQNAEMMTYTITPTSWLVPNHFARLILYYDKNDNLPYAAIDMANFEDLKMDSIHFIFYDSLQNVQNVLFENEIYVDSSITDIGIKRMLIPYDYLMEGLLSSESMEIAYLTTRGWFTMHDIPQAHLRIYIENCPQLKATMDKLDKTL